MTLGAQATREQADRLIFRPPFWPGSVLVGLGRWWESTISDIEVRIIGHASKIRHPKKHLEAPTTEAT